MGLITFSQFEILAFMIVFVRIAAMMVWFPIFGDNTTPVLMKILFSFLIALILYPLVKDKIVSPMPTETLALGLLVINETAIGLLIGLVAKTIFYAVSLAAQAISFQMGLSIGNVIDPSTSEQTPVIGQFHTIIATLVFLLINAHHVFFEALVGSYSSVAPGTFALKDTFLSEILRITSNIFIVGFKVAAPVIVVLLITNAGFGVIARAMPQMNVFMVSFPITIALGFIIMGLTIPILIIILGNGFSSISDDIFKILRTI